MQLKGWLITVLLSTVCVLGMMMFYIDLSGIYGVTSTDPAYVNTFNKMNYTMSLSENMTDMVNKVDVGNTGVIEIVGIAWRGGWTIVKLTFSTIGIMHSTVVDSAEIIGIPSYFTNVLLAIIIICLLFMFASILLQWEVNT